MTQTELKVFIRNRLHEALSEAYDKLAKQLELSGHSEVAGPFRELAREHRDKIDDENEPGWEV